MQSESILDSSLITADSQRPIHSKVQSLKRICQDLRAAWDKGEGLNPGVYSFLLSDLVFWCKKLFNCCSLSL